MREIFGVLASLCAIVGFVAGTTASSIYEGIVWAGMLCGGGLLPALAISDLEAHRNAPMSYRAARGLSGEALGLITVAAVLLLVALFWDSWNRGDGWNQSFGIAQLAGSIFIAAGAYVIWQEAILYREQRHKKCPECARTVLIEARKCQYCSHRFDAA
jgi:Uncharacterised protein family UPF0547